MAAYRLGSFGEAVSRIQIRLRETKFYTGPVDGDFGGGTERAVEAFQKANSLEIDGVVGPDTWTALFGKGAPPKPAPGNALLYRVVALTGAFETSTKPPECFAGLSGDFDGQGISFGALQQNFGQRSLQPLLLTMAERHPDKWSLHFGAHADVLSRILARPWPEQMAWARSIQSRQRGGRTIDQPWLGMFKALGRDPDYQQIQIEAVQKVFDKAKALAAAYGLRSERAVALMFDIVTQNGSIHPTTEALIRGDFAGLGGGWSEALEQARMLIVARRRAAAARPQYVKDVLSRKETIATGLGRVHGAIYDLDDYGLTLKPAA